MFVRCPRLGSAGGAAGPRSAIAAHAWVAPVGPLARDRQLAAHAWVVPMGPLARDRQLAAHAWVVPLGPLDGGVLVSNKFCDVILGIRLTQQALQQPSLFLCLYLYGCQRTGCHVVVLRCVVL